MKSVIPLKQERILTKKPRVIQRTNLLLLLLLLLLMMMMKTMKTDTKKRTQREKETTQVI